VSGGAPARARSPENVTTRTRIVHRPTTPGTFNNLREASFGGLEGSALFTLSRTSAFSSAAVVLSLQPHEMIREALDSLFGLGGELVGYGIINPYRGGHDPVSAVQEGTSLAEQRLRLLGCLRRQGGRAQVRGRAVCHGDSFPLSHRGGLCSGATSPSATCSTSHATHLVNQARPAGK
jgi:hypothetical protein